MNAYFELPFCVLKLTGNVQKLFAGIATNTESASRNALIDVYGKIVIVFYQKFSASGGAHITFNKQFLQRFREHAGLHLRLGKVEAKETNLKAFFIAQESENKRSAEKEEKNGDAPATQLGKPHAGNLETKREAAEIKIPEKGGSILLSENPPQGLRKMGEEGFYCYCLENGVSMQGKEFDSEMIMNTDWKGAVSFTKGCFLGQEITVKIMHRGKPPKRLVRLAFEKEPQSILRNSEPVGEVRSKCFSKKLGKWIAYCSVPNDGLGIDNAEMLE